MSARFRLPSILLVFVYAGGAAQTVPIQPTVTYEMGHVGGKSFGKAPGLDRTRHYFVAAEPVQWDYAPLGKDPVCGKTLPPPIQDNQLVGKLHYVQYTDDSFSARAFSCERLGILGPVLRGVVGETLVVTFLNRASVPLSIHPHGVKYDRDNEGAWHDSNAGRGAAIGPGAKFTYVWHLDEASGPLPSEPSSKAWLYHSHVTGEQEVNQGLIGFIVVTDPKRARADGTPNDVDREMAALFMIFDESGLDADAIEAAEYANASDGVKPQTRDWTETQQMLEAGGRHAINGLVFGNLKGLEMNEGERVRWYVFGLGSEDDFHTAHWHGARVIEEGWRRTDVVDLLPATMKVADMFADNPGSWLFHCHVSEHMREGMFTQFTVHPKADEGCSREPTRAFFGLSTRGQSLRVTHAQMLEARSEVRVAGVATVFEAFSIFNHTIKFSVGDELFVFQPDQSGVSTVNHCTLRIRNANRLGIIYGGELEFDLSIKGAASQAWAKLIKPGQRTRINLEIGNARHSEEAVFSQVPQ